MKSFQRTVRSRLFAPLTAGLCFALAGTVGAQVVEDKAPQPPAKVNSSDTVKEAVPPTTTPASSASKAANDTKAATDVQSAADVKASTEKPAAEVKTNTSTSTSGQTSTGNTSGAANTSTTGKVDTSGAKVGTSANTTTQGTTGTARTGAGNTTTTQGTAGAAAQGTVNQGTRTFSNDSNGANSAAGRINAGIQAGANAVNAAANVNAATNVNANYGRYATQLGLNWAANATNALTLSTVAQNSVFANAGFLPGDQFVSFAGTPITNQAAFYRYLGTVPAGQRIPVVVMRNGRQQTLYWTPDQRFVQLQPTFREVAVEVQPAAGGNSLGIQLDEQATDAAIVADVAAGSPAANAGVRRGDQIVALNDQEVHNAAQFHSAASQLPANSAVRISVARTIDLQASPVQQTGAVVPAGPAYVQPAAPVGVVDPARPIAPVRRFRFR